MLLDTGPPTRSQVTPQSGSVNLHCHTVFHYIQILYMFKLYLITIVPKRIDFTVVI